MTTKNKNKSVKKVSTKKVVSLKKVQDVKTEVSTTGNQILRGKKLTSEIMNLVIKKADNGYFSNNESEGLKFDEDSLKEGIFERMGFDEKFINSSKGVSQIVMGMSNYSKLNKFEKELVDNSITAIPEYYIDFEEKKRVEKFQGSCRTSGLQIDNKRSARIMLKFNHIGKMGKEIEKGWLNVPKELRGKGDYKDFGLALETIIHEGVHLICSMNKVNDCSRTQYHNKKFKMVAEKMGLEVGEKDSKGYGQTQMTQKLLDLITDNFDVQEIKEVFNFNDSAEFGDRKQTQKKRISWSLTLPSGTEGKSMTTKGIFDEKIEYLESLIDPATGQTLGEMGVIKYGKLMG